MRYCKKCNKNIKDIANFCTYCGEPNINVSVVGVPGGSTYGYGGGTFTAAPASGLPSFSSAKDSEPQPAASGKSPARKSYEPEPSSESLEQCIECGRDIEPECATAIGEYGQMCNNCFASYLKSDMNFHKKMRSGGIAAILLMLLFYAGGAFLIVTAVLSGIEQGAFAVFTSGDFQAVLKGLTDNTFIVIGIGAVLCGIATAFVGWEYGRAKKQWESKHGSAYTVTNKSIYKNVSGGRKFLRVLLALIFGVIVTPIRIVARISLAVKSGKEIRDDKKTIAGLKISSVETV